MSSKTTEIEQQLLENLFSQLIHQQLLTFQGTQQLFFYVDIVITTCKKIQQICNNSRPALEQLCCYLVNKLISFSIEIPVDVEHELLRRLRVEEKYVAHFTQICFRLILLGCLCILGDENNKKQWRQGLEQLMKQARIEFMFNYHDSLATTFVTFVNKVEEICHQFTFYEKIAKLFIKYDMEYVAEEVKSKMAIAKENWKLEINKNKEQFRKKTDNQAEKKVESSATTSKLKNRKSIKFVSETEKRTPDQNLRQRISDFRQISRKRQSEHFQSSKKRTIFQSRKYMIKTATSSQSFEQEQSIYIQQNQQVIEHEKKSETRLIPQHKRNTNQTLAKSINKKQPTVSKELQKSSNKPKKQEMSNLEDEQCGSDEGFMVPGTPPRRKRQNRQI